MRYVETISDITMETPKFAEMLPSDFPHAKKRIQRPKTTYAFLQQRKRLGLENPKLWKKEKSDDLFLVPKFSVSMSSSPFLQLIFPLYSLPDITFPSLVSHIRISWRCESGVSKLASHCERLLQQQRHSRKLQSPSDIITIEADVSKNRLSTHGATGNWEKLIYKCYIFPVFFANMSESTLLVLPIIWRCLSCCLFIFYYKK